MKEIISERGKSVRGIKQKARTVGMAALLALALCACAEKTAESDAVTVDEGASQEKTAEQEQTIEQAQDEPAVESWTKLTDMPEEAKSSYESFQKMLKDGGNLLGAANLSYVGDMTGGMYQIVSDILEYDGYADAYPFLTEVDQSSCVEYTGEVLFVFVPREDLSVTIYADEITDAGEYAGKKDTVLFQGKDGEPVFVRCNESDLFSNICVTVSGQQEEADFHPFISLKDGTLEMDAEGFFDFTLSEQVIQWGYLYDMPGDWWSDFYQDQNGEPLAYSLKLETTDGDAAVLTFTYGSDQLCYRSAYGEYWLIDEKEQEYGYRLYLDDTEREGSFFMKQDGEALYVSEGSGDSFFPFTDTPEAAFWFSPDPDLSAYDYTVTGAYSWLNELDDVRYHRNCGMVFQYMEETQEINGQECLVFEMGTDREDQFVREYFYAVSPEDYTTYVYDAEKDEWTVLGQG